MPVIDALRLVFVHVPKTAGWSAQLALGLRPEDPAWDQATCSGHDPYGTNADHYTLTQILTARPDVASYLRTAVVREPYSRVLSLWAWCQRHPSPDVRLENDFRSFVRRLPWTTDSHLLMKFFQPQWEFVRVGRRLGVDLLGRFEDLSAWWTTLGDRLGATLPALGHENASQHPSVREAYDEATARHVRDVYAVDFTEFGYPEELPCC